MWWVIDKRGTNIIPGIGRIDSVDDTSQNPKSGRSRQDKSTLVESPGLHRVLDCWSYRQALRISKIVKGVRGEQGYRLDVH